MLVDISSPQSLGLLIGAARKNQKVRMDDLAGTAGVGPVFVREVERGKETVQLGRVFKLLAELGIQLKVDVPDEVGPAFVALKQVGVKPLTRRKPPPARADESGRSETRAAPDPSPHDSSTGDADAGGRE